MQKGVFGRFCLARIDYNQLHPVLHGLLHGLTRVDREALLGDYRISADHDPGFRTGECIWSCHPATVKRLRDHLACLLDRLDGSTSTSVIPFFTACVTVGPGLIERPCLEITGLVPTMIQVSELANAFGPAIQRP